ncbi:MAG: undecaprenyl-diphosphatase UppP [Ignavibacteriales bacterium]|nr:undecaprenyl-diphosphatase UppP [Ignavibacteriales bacterium]
MLILKAILLGVVQGLTEFIPISSSAHLVIIPWMFRWDDPALESLTFDVALHLGTLAALLAFFAKDWARIIRAGVSSIAERRIGEDIDRRLAWFLVIATIPGGFVGLLLEKKIEHWFHPAEGPIQSTAMIAMAVLIALLGAFLFIAEKLAAHRRRMNQVTFRDSIIIGLAQAMAIFPGVSRSGSTITAGMALGLERETAARFSFLLSAPIIAGAGMKSLYKIYQGMQDGSISGSDFNLFIIGFAAAALSGYVCIKYLLRFLQNHPTNVFVYYRWVLALVVLIVALMT